MPFPYLQIRTSKMTDNLSEEKRSWNMRQIRNKNTMPEILVRSLIHAMGLRFRLHKKNLPGCPDIVLTKCRTVVFVHGCYWHRHLGCKYASTPKTNTAFWLKKFTQNTNRDTENYCRLKKLGWNVLIIWQCETKDIAKLRKRLAVEFRQST
jgi:DNA mismatch endonuclease (patch repair protein)